MASWQNSEFTKLVEKDHFKRTVTKTNLEREKKLISRVAMLYKTSNFQQKSQNMQWNLNVWSSTEKKAVNSNSPTEAPALDLLDRDSHPARAQPLHSCLTDPVGGSPPGSSVHGIPQARTLEWAAIFSSRGSSWPRDWTSVSCSSCTAGRFFASEPQGKPSIGDFQYIQRTKGKHAKRTKGELTVSQR